MQAANGVIDVAVADEAEAVAVTKQLLAFFQGADAARCRARPGRACATWSPSGAAAPTTSAR